MKKIGQGSFHHKQFYNNLASSDYFINKIQLHLAVVLEYHEPSFDTHVLLFGYVPHQPPNVDSKALQPPHLDVEKCVAKYLYCQPLPTICTPHHQSKETFVLHHLGNRLDHTYNTFANRHRLINDRDTNNQKQLLVNPSL